MHSFTRALVLLHSQAHYLPLLQRKGVRKSLFGYPSQEDFYSKKYHLQGCIPDFPRPRDWGCVNCDAAFFKEKEAVVDYMAETYRETDDQVDDWFEVARKKVLNYRAKSLWFISSFLFIIFRDMVLQRFKTFNFSLFMLF